jgi:REP element-mobilizing transposase RayT
MQRNSAFHQLYFHFVWATRRRLPLIQPQIEERLFAYIGAKCVELGYVLKVSGLDATLYWQDGYGVVTLRKAEVSSVVAYIQRQKEHHACGRLSDVLERTLL